MLKIFKDIMQKEHNDLQKKEAGKEKRKKRKKSSVFPSKAKSQGKYEKSDSSGVTKMKPAKYIIAEGKVRDGSRVFKEESSQSHINPLYHEKRESWWLWGDSLSSHGKKHIKSSTCTCVSCQLKKVLTNEYACIAILIFLFCISMILAWILLSKTCLAETGPSKQKTMTNFDVIDDKFKVQPSTDDYKRLDFGREIRRSIWDDDSVSKSGDSALSGFDFADPNLITADRPMQYGLMSSDLPSLLDPQKFTDEKVSPQIKNFYKKLLETDAQIKNLRKGLYNPNMNMNIKKDAMFRLKRSLFHNSFMKGKETKKPMSEDKKPVDVASEIDRDSIFVEGFSSMPVKDKKKDNENDDTNQKKKKKTKANSKPAKKVRRFANGSAIPEGYVYEKKQIIIKYLQNPNQSPKFPKCSHVQKEPDFDKDKEYDDYDQIKPKNRNSERLDRLLDQFLKETDQLGLKEEFHKPLTEVPTKETPAKTPEFRERTLGPSSTISTTEMTPYPELSSPYASEASKYRSFFIPHTKAKKKMKLFWKPGNEDVPVTRKGWKSGVDSSKMDSIIDDLGKKDDIDLDDVTVPQYDVVLSISTLMNPSQYEYATQNSKRKAGKFKMRLSDKDERVFDKMMAKIPVRKLQQFEDQEQDEEGLGYEDFKEVLSDDTEGHDETDRQGERDRRFDEGDRMKDVLTPPTTHNPATGVFNPNWKGPAPLYPDEINSMMKKPTEMVNQPSTKTVPEYLSITLGVYPKLKELDYISNFLSKKYDRLINLAQAYSDYGVLSEKNENSKTMSQEKSDHKLKISTERPQERLKRRTMLLNITTVIFERPKTESTKLVDLPYSYSEPDTTPESEGLSVNFEPYGTKPCEDDEPNFVKSLSKHVSFSKPVEEGSRDRVATTLMPMNPAYDVVFNPSHYLAIEKKKANKIKDSDYNFYKDNIRSSKSSNEYYEDNRENSQNYLDPQLKVAKNNAPVKSDLENLVLDEMKSHHKSYTSEKSNINPNKNNPYFTSKTPEKVLSSSLIPLIPGKIDINDLPVSDDMERGVPDNSNANDDILEVTSTTEYQKFQKEFPLYTAMLKNNPEFILSARVANDSKILEAYTNKDRLKRQITTYANPEPIEKVNDLNNSTDLILNAESAIAKAFNKFTNDIKDIEKKSDVKILNGRETSNDKEMGAGDFLSLLSNWFLTMAGTSADVANESIALEPKSIKSPSKVTKDSYPVYDSDLVDNIGHRSRVLLSFEEDHATVTDSSSEEEKSTQKSVSDSHAENTTLLANMNKTDTDTILISAMRNASDKNLELNKTMDKRNVDQNLVFWSDMYDDEYGIKLDPLDEDQETGKRGEGVVKKSAGWLQNKMKKMTDSIKKRSKDSFNKMYKINKKDNRDADALGMNTVLKNNLNNIIHKINKRESLSAAPYAYDRKNSFAVMTAHMKNVCKQAAEAVQKTRSIKPREDHESEVARGLMQHLVKLMSDLVDYEVQQRTCLSLPADLKGFLDWLTMPVPTPGSGHAKNLEIVYPTEEVEIPGGTLSPVSLVEDVDVFYPDKNVRITVTKIPARTLKPPWLKFDLPKNRYPDGRLEHVMPTVNLKQKDNPWLTICIYRYEPFRALLGVCGVLLIVLPVLFVILMLTTKSSEREEMRTDARSECLGTLQAVQDLMMEYSKLSDEDKIKMFGVKEYLEGQLDFLNKQIGSLDEANNIANIYAKNVLMPLRIRRDLRLKNPEFLRRRQFRHSNRRDKRRFLKNYSKKHTKSTANNFESLQVSTEAVNKVPDIPNIPETCKKEPKVEEVEVEEDTDTEKEEKKRDVKQDDIHKRNLQDVYYKALADAKKLTTLKNLPRQALVDASSDRNNT